MDLKHSRCRLKGLAEINQQANDEENGCVEFVISVEVI